MTRRLLAVLLALALGVITAVVGAAAYRDWPWIGVSLCIALVLFSMLFVRAWVSWSGVIAFAVPWAALTFLFTRQGPGGSLLIPSDTLGYAWIYGATAAIVLVCLVPPSLIGRGRVARD